MRVAQSHPRVYSRVDAPFRAQRRWIRRRRRRRRRPRAFREYIRRRDGRAAARGRARARNGLVSIGPSRVRSRVGRFALRRVSRVGPFALRRVSRVGRFALRRARTIENSAGTTRERRRVGRAPHRTAARRGWVPGPGVARGSSRGRHLHPGVRGFERFEPDPEPFGNAGRSARRGGAAFRRERRRGGVVGGGDVLVFFERSDARLGLRGHATRVRRFHDPRFARVRPRVRRASSPRRASLFRRRGPGDGDGGGTRRGGVARRSRANARRRPRYEQTRSGIAERPSLRLPAASAGAVAATLAPLATAAESRAALDAFARDSSGFGIGRGFRVPGGRVRRVFQSASLRACESRHAGGGGDDARDSQGARRLCGRFQAPRRDDARRSERRARRSRPRTRASTRSDATSRRRPARGTTRRRTRTPTPTTARTPPLRAPLVA